MLIRHILPGLVFAIEFVALGYFGFPDRIANRWNDLIAAKDSAAIIIGAITLFLGSGALGYLFAVMHHLSINTVAPWLRGSTCAAIRFFGRMLPAFDYYPVLKYLVDNEKLTVEGPSGTIELAKAEMVRDWIIITILWHERRETNQQIKAATARAESLWEKAHGAGTCLVASVFAFGIAAVVTLCCACSDGRFHQTAGGHPDLEYVGLVSCGFLLGVVAIVIHLLTCRFMVDLASRFVETIVANQVRYDAQKDGQKVRVYYVADGEQPASKPNETQPPK